MTVNKFRIPKTQKQVSLWVHPEGLVICSLYLREESKEYPGGEEPLEVLNQNMPFVVVRLDKPDQLRFYNQSSIIRVEYELDSSESKISTGHPDIGCCLHMMDGSIIDGTIRETLPADRARLFDYLNKDKDRFLRIYTSDTEICLINKTYINHVTLTDNI